MSNKKAYYILTIVLALPMWSFAVNCPENTNLDDKSSRNKCIVQALTHWEKEIEKRIIEKWQNAYYKKPTGGDARAGNWRVYSDKSVEDNLEKLIRIYKVLDRVTDEGVYQLPYKQPSD